MIGGADYSVPKVCAFLRERWRMIGRELQGRKMIVVTEMYYLDNKNR